MSRALAVLLLASFALAGCFGGGNADAGSKDDKDGNFDDFDLDATETTGVIRGVVFDSAIVPLAGASVAVTGPTTADHTTGPNGTFGFAGLKPGTYFVKAMKVGYFPAQSSIDVVAGEDQPEPVKLLMEADPVTTPFAQGYVFDGFIECSVSIVAVGFAACSAIGGLNDRFIEEYQLERPPTFSQSEMHWETTQAVSDALRVLYSAPGESALLDNYAQAGGPSPLMINANATTMAEYGIGNGSESYPLQIRVFNEPIEGTRPNDPVGGDDCLDRPVLGGCATGVGFTIEQDFTIYTHVFYGYEPEDGWLFSVDGEPAPPE